MSFGPPGIETLRARANWRMNGGWPKVFWKLTFRGVGWLLVGICVGVGMRLVG